MNKMEGCVMDNNMEKKERKIYVTPLGGMYVDPKDLLEDPEVIAKIDKMAELFGGNASKGPQTIT